MKLVKALVYLAFLLLTQSVHGKKCRCKTNMNTIAKAQSSMEELTSRVDELEEKENKRAIVKGMLNA